MRLLQFLTLATALISMQAFSQTHLQPLQPGGTVPPFFHCPSQQGVTQQIEARERSGNPMNEKEQKFTREMSYYAQQRTMTGLVLFNDSLSNYVTKVAAVLLKNDTALFNKLHFYVYKDPQLNAYTSATGNILITVGLLAQLENEAQLAFILAHEITHFKQEHMLKGYLNREEMREKENYNTQEYYSYNQEQELEADRLGFELYMKSPYAISDAKRSFDILEYSDLPFDDVPFDTLFFNKDYMKVPVGYYRNEVDPIYTDDNYEDRSSTHPNVRKRRMALLSTMDTVSETGRVHFAVSKDEFLIVREKARYEMCRLLLLQRDYPEAIYASFLMLQKHPNDLELKKIIGYSMFNMAAYKQSGATMYSFWGGFFWRGGSRYSALQRSSYYSVPDFADYPGQQQQVFHLFKEMEADEMTVMALSYNWYIYREDKSDSLQSRLCDSLFSMLVNKQNLHRTYFSTITPAQAQEELRQDSIKKAQETGEVGDSKYSRLDKFRISSEKERFIKFAFVELMKDTEFVARFDYYTDHRRSLVGAGTTGYSWTNGETKEEREKREADEKKYGYGVNKVIVVNPDYNYYHEPDRKEDPEQEYPKSEQGQVELCTIVDQTAQSEGVDAIVLSPFLMDSLDTDTFSDYALLNEWFYERMQYGTNNYATNLANKAEIDSLIARYGTPYVMFTNVEAAYLKRIQHPVWFAISCVAVFPVIYGFIPRREFYYDAVVLDLRTGEVVHMEDKKIKRGHEKEHTSKFFKEFFNKLKRPVQPPDPKPVPPAGLRD
ncbi:MAG TPA: M48 family metallopeptidase [Bacteroidia bacterium]|nr:M48 family metallopeptidase [Bacteroidia bacterium]